MPVTIPYTFQGGPGNKALASQVNANFQALASKFTTAASGISDADISDTAGIKGSKLNNVAGNRIPTDRIEDDAIDASKLRDDVATDINRAVSTNHLRDGAVTAPKLGSASVVTSKLKLQTYTALASTLFGTASLGPDLCRHAAAVGLNKTLVQPLFAYIEHSVAFTTGADSAQSADLQVRTRSSDNLIYLTITNSAPSGNQNLANLTVKLLYVENI